MDMLNDAIQDLNDQFDEFAAIEVVYVRSDGTRLTIPATVGRTRFRFNNNYGTSIVKETRDYLISEKHLGFTPGRGDIIEDDGQEYQLSAPNNEALWNWADDCRKCRRIHTSLVGEVENDY